VSDVIKVAKGLMLVKVVDYKPGDAQPFEQVKTKVQDSLIKQKSQEKFADMKEKLANLTYEHPDSLDPAAKALGLTVNVSRAFTRDKGADEISSNQKIRDVAFSQDVLTSQNNSDVIQATPDAVVVLRDKSHETASVQPLDAVKADVVAKLKAVAAEQKAADVAAQIKQKLTDGEPIDQVAADNHVTWTKPGFIGRYATTVDSAILYTAFKLPRPQSGHPLYATVKVPTGYAVVAANGVRDGVIDPKNQQQYDIFADQIQNTQGLLEYKLYEESLKQKATVKYSADFSQG
jgi:peptidyl-prolyl cis-trans isomerase D